MDSIPAARLVSCESNATPGRWRVSRLVFEVPINYADERSESIRLFARSVLRDERPIVRPHDQTEFDQVPYLVFLQGGPGFGCPDPQSISSLTNYVLNRGYQLLLLDYRGTGLSTPVNARHLRSLGSPQDQANYLKFFRADNIVRDCEAVRKCLTENYAEGRKMWSLLGQSYGGFVSLTYLSKYPHGLREVFLTGGLAPIKRTAEEVYRATYKKAIERNEAYYRKFPMDVARIRKILNYIQKREGGISLPAGGLLTVQRFLTLGMAFGFHGGFDTVNSTIFRMSSDLDQFGFFTRATLRAVEEDTPFDSNPIYAILHESVYCTKKGEASNWAAARVGAELPLFGWTKDEDNLLPVTPPFFSGEMIFPFHFETHPELKEMREAANILASFDGWDELYNEEQLRVNVVPVYAASYVDDIYVDFEFARETAKIVRKIKVYETNVLYHNALKAKTEEVLDHLFALRDDSLD
ncbi:proline iminopeptidase 1 [Echria macrotheca]|uniref:Proline iminopeptidase 1 n=1 Tax=Echria macrotheca TaxID=438768 RepID=A0AAJ0BBU8_9PEZI|nr:proline iminopeptidase 1 [Echria macrotheca]